MPIVLFYRNFLEEFRADDFDTREKAQAFVKELEAKEKPDQSIFLLYDDNDLRTPKSGAWRKAVYDLIAEEGHESKPDELISAERLWLRLETWMKE